MHYSITKVWDRIHVWHQRSLVAIQFISSVCIPGGYFKYLMVHCKTFYYITYFPSHLHRQLLKVLCWSRRRRSQWNLKMWSECFRTVQRILWSGSRKVIFLFLFSKVSAATQSGLFNLVRQTSFMSLQQQPVHTSLHLVSISSCVVHTAAEQSETSSVCLFSCTLYLKPSPRKLQITCNSFKSRLETFLFAAAFY